MIDQRPVFIAAPPRSGTTMIAGLLGKHGVWIGRGRTTRYPGTNPEFVSENQDIKTVFKQAGKKEGCGSWMVPDTNMKGLYLSKEDIEQFVPDGKVWLIKTSWTLLFYESLIQMYPNALWVLPWRHEEDVFDSMNRHPAMSKRDDKSKREFIEGLQKIQMDVFCKARYAMFFDVKAMSKCKEGEMIKLFGFVGIKPNWEIITNWINPQIMKHTK